MKSQDSAKKVVGFIAGAAIVAFWTWAWVATATAYWDWMF